MECWNEHCTWPQKMWYKVAGPPTTSCVAMGKCLSFLIHIWIVWALKEATKLEISSKGWHIEHTQIMFTECDTPLLPPITRSKREG